LSIKKSKTVSKNFSFRLKLGEYEVEVGGTREEVLKTIENLPSLMGSINKAFESLKPRKVATLTVKTEAPKGNNLSSESYPQITSTESVNEAVLRILETDWGKWRPRTLEELRGALKANGQGYPAKALATVLQDLVKEEKIRRWNTDTGYVYILAEKEAFQPKR
jgi:hypothetical protein